MRSDKILEYIDRGKEFAGALLRAIRGRLRASGIFLPARGGTANDCGGSSIARRSTGEIMKFMGILSSSSFPRAKNNGAAPSSSPEDNMRSRGERREAGRLIEIPLATSFLERGEGLEHSSRAPPKAGGRLRNPGGRDGGREAAGGKCTFSAV